MALDLQEFGGKLRRYREQLQVSVNEVSLSTGITLQRMELLENGSAIPTGDEILILADFYQCDYRFFISNERLAPFEQTENLYRRYGNEFSRDDRRRVQEFLYLCECEEFLMQTLNRVREEFRYEPRGTYFKGHAEEAADELRQHFRYSDDAVPSDVYSDFRTIGIHVFRRRLDNSNISGLTVRHPTAGPCILVNYSEDLYRQRFTAAHEAAHALMDKGDFVVSFSQWNKKDLIETRANTFASRYLLPPAVLRKLPVTQWTDAEILTWATKLKVSTAALAIGLKETGIIGDQECDKLMKVRVGRELKSDPELEGLTSNSLQRKKTLLERGLSSSYVWLCFEAISEGAITNAKAAEMLLVDDGELSELAEMFRVKTAVHD
jgi:Zn-dependent peptidase ImmA (M78 family)